MTRRGVVYITKGWVRRTALGSK